jgi:hypothetical protein
MSTAHSLATPAMTSAEGDTPSLSLVPKEVAKFAVLVGLGGIYFDAAIAHGLFWENDPYWTYWITTSFLITTVFCSGRRS